MESGEAKELMAAAQEVNSHLNHLAELSELIPDVELQRQIRLTLGHAMAKVYLGLMRPVVRQFPQFDPDPPEV